jgi:hypothetical protein
VESANDLRGAAHGHAPQLLPGGHQALAVSSIADRVRR